MKKTKKIIITVLSIIVLLTIGIYVYYNYFYDPNALNITEKKWLDDHKSNVITFNMPNDINVFSSSGDGVVYNFLDDFSKNYTVNIDKNIIDNNKSGLGFVNSTSYTKKDLLLYTDHYVVVSKNNDVITSMSDLSGKYVGGLSDSISRLTNAYNVSVKYTIYENKTDLLDNFKNSKIEYIIIPLNEYIDVILKNDYKIVYHLNDIVNYYYIKLGDDSTLNSIVKKYYNIWSKTSLKKSYYESNYNLFIDTLGLSEIDTDSLTNKTYNYGFVSSTPYQTLNSSKYGGIVISYLNEFSNFSNVEFEFTKYKTDADLISAYNDKKIDLMFNNTELNSKDYLVPTNFNIKYYLVSPLSKNLYLSSINELNNTDEVYVINHSLLYNYLKSLKNVNIKTIDNERQLLKNINKGNLTVIDANTYDYLVNKKIKNSYVSYSGYVNSNYGFKYQKNNDTFYKLFSFYANYVSPSDMINYGKISYKEAESSGNIIASLAKYFLLIVSACVVVAGIIIASKKHVKLNTKIKKDEKLKFVDMLTSLKNRNYLNERISVWNQNTIYPQAIIVIDLNNIKYLNDTFGHEEGDTQIKAAANVLHQTQPDNSEIMRTDGNEFMVYLVGYNEKQVVNYLKKLVKEFNNLPYEYGAAFGFSMIVDDLKLLDDAINEATLKMRENKEIEARDEEKES